MAPAARRSDKGGLGPDRANVAVGQSHEALDDVLLVREPAAEEMNQERRRHVAGHRHGCRHGAVSVVPVVGNGGRAHDVEIVDYH